MSPHSSAPLPPSDIEALADQFSACADALHQRLMRAIRQRGVAPAGHPDELSNKGAEALFDLEVTLRQRANSLYLDAAELAGRGLAGQQQQLRELMEQARQRIDQIAHLKDMIDISAELLALGAALASGKPERLLAPLEKLRKQLAPAPAGPPPGTA